MNRKIVCWIGDAPNHKALVAKIAEKYPLTAVIVDRKKNLSAKKSARSLLTRIIDKLRFGKIDAAWSALQNHYREKYPDIPETKIKYTDSINNEEVYTFMKEIQPDLVIVSGTSLIKEPLVSLPMSVGIMNLHTGLSPYVKGGPNCTNWCIANNEWGLIGNTILWLSAGIDSGNIITSERVDLSDLNDLPAIHLRVMEQAHTLYLRAIDYVMTHEPPYPSVPQSGLGKGQLYLTRMWTASMKRKLLMNLRHQGNQSVQSGVKEISLPA